MITGRLIAESLLTGATLDHPGLGLTRITRQDISARAGPDQPSTWTIVDFTAPDETAEDLAEAFAAMLSPTGGWYCDFRVGDDHVVIFADKVFRYRHGDPAAAAEARAWGRRTGVPTHQLDWEA